MSPARRELTCLHALKHLVGPALAGQHLGGTLFGLAARLHESRTESIACCANESHHLGEPLDIVAGPGVSQPDPFLDSPVVHLHDTPQLGSEPSAVRVLQTKLLQLWSLLGASYFLAFFLLALLALLIMSILLESSPQTHLSMKMNNSIINHHHHILTWDFSCLPEPSALRFYMGKKLNTQTCWVRTTT